jgi:hypothetical protein
MRDMSVAEAKWPGHRIQSGTCNDGSYATNFSVRPCSPQLYPLSDEKITKVLASTPRFESSCMVAPNSSSAVMIARIWLAHICWPCAVVKVVLRTQDGLSLRSASGTPAQGATGALAYFVSGIASLTGCPPTVVSDQ